MRRVLPFLVAAIALAQVRADEAPPVRRALLIGVNDYVTDQFGDLNGAVNDVETMRGLLVSRFGFSPENVATLTDRQATREAILAAIRKVVSETGPKDTLYLHYSGHGSQAPDADGDEGDGRDETIVPSDGRTEGIADITDDEIGALLAEVQADNCVIVMDSCHSGTVTRGALRTRTVPPDPRTALYERAKIRKRSVVQHDRPDRCLLLTGAASNESALDGPVEDGKNHGMFSWSLSKALASEPASDPATATHEHVQTTFRALSESFGGVRFPDPQFEGTAARLAAPIFPDGGAPTAAPAPPPAPATRFAIRLEIADAARRSAVTGLLRERVPAVDVAGPDAFARFVVSASGTRWEIRDGAGLSVVESFEAAADADAVARLAEEFERSLRASALIALTNPASRLEVSAALVGAGADAPMRIRRDGEPRSPANSLQLEVLTSADAYLTIVDVDAEGSVNVLFPNGYTRDGFLPDGRVRAGEPIRIPDSLASGNRAGFFWDVRPPAGIDTIQVFASTDLETATAIRNWLKAAPAPQTRGAAASSKPAPVDARRLSSLREKLGTRGFAVVKDEPEAGSPPPPDWNASLVRVRIEE
jgi:hypothetical protein